MVEKSRASARLVASLSLVAAVGFLIVHLVTAPPSAVESRPESPAPLAAVETDLNVRDSRTQPSRPAEAPAPVDTRTPELRRALHRKVAELALELQDRLSDHPEKARYDACLAAGTPDTDDCQRAIANVVNLAIFRTDAKRRIGAGELGLDALVGSSDWRKASEALADLVASSPDPLERITALMFMRYDVSLSEPEHAVALPEEAYRNLQDRPLTEAWLLAERHRAEPPPDDAIGEFAALAESSDTRAQSAALLALGHSATSQELHQVVLGLPLTSESWFEVAHAVSSCGMQCAETMRHVLASAPEEARIAIYEALGFAPPGDREQMAELAVAAAPSRLGERERKVRDELLADALPH